MTARPNPPPASPAQGRLLDALLARIGERVAPDRIESVREFARAYVRRILRTSPSDSMPRSSSAWSWACSSSPTAAA